MKKALTLLAVAAMAAVSFVGCSKTYDVDATLDTGMENYDFNGKTLVKTDTSYITKTDWATTAGTVSTRTETKSYIPYKQDLTTVTFKDDGTFTATKVTSYLAAADGDYRTVNATTSGTNYNYGSNTVVAGYAGVTEETDTISGTWKTYTYADQAGDGTTLKYAMYVTAYKTVSSTFDDGTSSPVDATTTKLSTTKETYAVYHTATTDNAVDANSLVGFDYTLKGTKADAAGDQKDFVNMSLTGYFSGDFIVSVQ